MHCKLAKENIFIIGGVASGKTSLIENLRDVLPHKKIDIGKLFRIAAYFFLNHNERNDIIKIDINKLRENDREEINKVNRLLSERMHFLKSLFKKIKITQEDNKDSIFIDSINVEKELYNSNSTDVLVSDIAKFPKIRKLVWKWVNEYTGNSPGNILTGHSLNEIDTTKYQIVNIRVDEREAAVRLFNNSLSYYNSLDGALNRIRVRNSSDKIEKTEQIIGGICHNIIIDTTNLTLREVKNKVLDELIIISKRRFKIKKEQKKYKISRQNFEWQTNPLLESIRVLGKHIFIDKAGKKQNSGICEFDLAIQTIIHLAAREVEDVWHGYQNNYKDNSAMDSMLFYLRNIKHEREKFYDALKNKKIILNENIIRAETERQLARLVELFKNTKTEYNGEKIELPAFYMAKTESNPFGKRNTETALIVSGGEKIANNFKSRTHQFIIREKTSNKKVIIKEVPKEISKLYAEGFHYLHDFREDEIASFGAYLENDLFPFAWVSYSPVNRKYKKEMLWYLGIENHRVVEMTRAWNSAWSPKNTMSVLFKFAHEELISKWKEKIKIGEADKTLAGVLTSINGNLGFKGSAFKGIGFKVIGLKPSRFTYLLSEDGAPIYTTRRTIFEQLGLAEISGMESHPKYAMNKFPLLPTNEMILLFNQEEDERLDKKAAYIISDNCYKEI